MSPPTITTATIPRSLLADAFAIVILAQERKDFFSEKAGEEFPSHQMMEFIRAAEAIAKANVILIEDPAPAEPTEQVPWEEDSMKKSEIPVKSPCTSQENGSSSTPEAALE